MNVRLASLARGACRLAASRGFERMTAAIAIVASYLALLSAITAVTVLHEQNRFREAPAFATDMVGAMDRLRTVAGHGGTPLSDAESSAVDEIKLIAEWFKSAGHSWKGPADSVDLVYRGTNELEAWCSFRTNGVVPKSWSGNPDPEGMLASAAGHIGGLPDSVKRDQEKRRQDLRHSGHAALAWASGATLIILPAVSSWRRRPVVVLRRRTSFGWPVNSPHASHGIDWCTWC